jgi:c-di-GMP-binding flagellar brake protein YcgR
MSEPDPNPFDRRQHERRPFRSMADLLLRNFPLLKVRTIDISSGGLSISSPTDIAPGSGGHIRVNIPTLRTSVSYNTQAEVMNSIYTRADDGFKVGLKFVNLPAPMATAVKSFLAA